MKLPSIQTRLSEFSGNSTYPLVNLLLFKLSWLLLVLGQDSMLLYAALLQALSLLLHPTLKKVLLPSILLAAFGILIDYLLSRAGVLGFGVPGFPLWLALLWFAFILALPQGFAFVGRLSRLLQMLCGMFAGSVSYWAGFKVGAISFPLPLMQTLGIIALIWGFFLPLAIHLLRPNKRQSFSSLLPICLLLLVVAENKAYADQQLIGQGQLKFLFRTIYDAHLYADTSPFIFPSQQAYTFTLQYHLNLSKQQIIKETLHQWQLQDIKVTDQWLTELESIIPDINTGDSLSLVVDKSQTARLQHNKHEIAVLTDQSFVLAFASIWPSENASKPELRHHLLGQP